MALVSLVKGIDLGKITTQLQSSYDPLISKGIDMATLNAQINSLTDPRIATGVCFGIAKPSDMEDVSVICMMET